MSCGDGFIVTRDAEKRAKLPGKERGQNAFMSPKALVGALILQVKSVKSLRDFLKGFF
jgi:hypothetical protein